MIGSILQIGLNMAAYAASARATRAGVKYVSSNFKRAVTHYHRRAQSADFATPRIRKAVLEATSRETSNRIKSFTHQVRDGSMRAIRSNTNPATRRHLKTLGRVVKDEAMFMPANYIYYQMEKHKAVSPEEKEATSSFFKFYAGAPMAASIGSGFILSNTNMASTAIKAIAKRTTAPQRQKMVSTIASTAKAGSAMMDNIIAGLRTARRRRSEYGMKSFLSFDASMRTRSQLAHDFKMEKFRLKQEPSKHTVLEKEINAFKAEIDRKLETRKSDLTKRGLYHLYFKEAEKQKGIMQGTARRNYQKQMQEPSAFMKLMNGIAEATGDLNLKTSRKTGHDGYIKDFGQYSIGSTDVDFGRMNLHFMKDMLIKRSGKGLPQATLRMFGVDEVLQYQHSEHALGTTFTNLGSGDIYLGKTYFDPNDAKSSRDLTYEILGSDPNLATPDEKKIIDAFHKSREDLITRRFKNEKGEGLKTDFAKDVAMKMQYRRGGLPVKGSDMLIHYPGGETHLLTTVNVDGKMLPTSMRIGGLSDGSFMSYYKFTREKSSAPAKIQRRMYGREERMLDNVPVSAGPTQVGDIIIDTEDTGLLSKLKRYLDIGSSETSSAFRKLTSIFTKWTDPRYAKTFFDERFIKNQKVIGMIADSDTLQYDTMQMLREESTNTMEYFVAKAVHRSAGQSHFAKFMMDLDINYAQPEFDMKNHLLSNDMSVEKGKLQVSNFEKLLQSFIDRKKLDPSLIGPEIDKIKRIKQVFHSGGGYTVHDQMGNLFSNKSYFINGKHRRITRIDEYNATVMRIVTGLHDTVGVSSYLNKYASKMEDFAYDGITPELKKAFRFDNMNPSDVSAFSAASGMSKLHHNLSLAIGKRNMSGLDEKAIEGSRREVENAFKIFLDPKNNDYGDVISYYSKGIRNASFAPALFDQRPKIGFPSSEEVYMIPKGMGTGIVSQKNYNIGHDSIEIADGIMDVSNISLMSVLNSFNRVTSETLGLGLTESHNATPGKFIKNTITKRVLPGMALFMGYGVVDRVMDKTMDGTPLGEGLTMFGANMLAGARIAAQSVFDATGVTSVSRYLEDLMPGIIESPLSGALRFTGPIMGGMSIGYKMGGSVGSLTGGLIGTAIGGLLGGGPLGIMGQWNIDKSREEVINILSGQEEIPVRKGRFWEMGQTDFLGTRIEYFRPHMYSVLRSKYKDTPGLKDSIFKETVGAIAPDIYALQNYYSRPYPVTAGLFSDIPIVSNFTSMLPGMPLLGGIEMHSDNWSQPYYKGVAADMGLDNRSLSGLYGTDNEYFSPQAGQIGGSGLGPGHSKLPTETPMKKTDFNWALGESMAQAQDIVGLRGFIASSMMSDMTGRDSFYDYAPVYDTPVNIAGTTKSFWELSAGGLLGTNEAFRRYVPKNRSQMQVFNPIPNAMPTWLPDESYMHDFQHGDAYSSINRGEIRLPGQAYETLRNIDIAMPVEADILAENYDSQIAYYLGFPEYMAERKRNEMVAKNVAYGMIEEAKIYGELIKEHSAVYNVENDVRATVDAIVRDEYGGSMPVKVTPKGYGGEAALNAYLNIAGINEGMLIEVDAESGATFEKLITRDAKRFSNDLARTAKSRMSAYQQIASYEKSGKAMNLGNSYSWIDRFRILADVAMYSDEYKEADAIIRQQMSAGKLRSDQIQEYYKIKDQVKQKRKSYDFAEYRFVGLGDSLTESGRARDAEIYDQYNIVERSVGRVWEHFSHLRTPIHSKLLHKRSALEEYERNAVFGKTLPMWQNPIEDFVKSYTYQAMNEDNPIQGALSWGLGGLMMPMIGGFGLAASMATAGSLNSSLNRITDTVYMPERTEERREIMEQLDAVKYAKYKALYAETGNKEYLKMASRTITGSLESDYIPDPKQAGYLLGKPESQYFGDIVENMRSGDVARIEQLLPETALPSMYQYLGNSEKAQKKKAELYKSQMGREIPEYGSSIYSEQVSEELPTITTFNMEGLNAHDAGMGWYSQMAAMNRLQRLGIYDGDSLYSNNSQTLGQAIGAQELNLKIRNVLQKYAKSVSIRDDGMDRIELEIIL